MNVFLHKIFVNNNDFKIKRKIDGNIDLYF